MALINQNSYTITAATVLVIAGVIAFRSGVSPRGIFSIGVLILLLISIFLLLRPGKSSLERVSQINTSIGAGKPVLIEFQSPY
jgi:hypothetical protein